MSATRSLGLEGVAAARAVLRAVRLGVAELTGEAASALVVDGAESPAVSPAGSAIASLEPSVSTRAA